MKMHFKIAAAAAAMAAICSMTAWAKDVANVDTCVIENGYITVSGRAWEEPDPVPETAGGRHGRRRKRGRGKHGRNGEWRGRQQPQ